MRNDGWNTVWDVWWWDSVMWNLYLNVAMCMAWNVGMMCHGVPRCGAVEWFDVNAAWCQCVWNVVRCECCQFKHGVIEMQNVWCGTWRGVLVCGMLHNTRCGKLRCDVNVVVWNCGDEECGIYSVLCDCCVMSDVEYYAMTCCDVRRGGVMRCGIWCGVKYAMMWM